ncbi:polyisoprenoid-binding protein [Marinobacterium zhoushanense]|uniref:Polyisoprenoid-binding protein n=1 Tax=Marinobacterium zhoushanense TaxID=1679163 RepID=A0ABQ1KTT8_9GAMM|nr:YceI family protein [Marinobacterium zhoushanense]GGC06034.1 polyisoprenoid-binding protein [Marinobacterium zhoushanense]
MKMLWGAILLFLFSWPASAADWRMVPDASRLTFESSYQGEAVPGQFRRFQAELTLDPDQPEDATLDVEVDISSADMSSSELDEGVATEEWFDVARYPQAEFHSRQIRRIDSEHYVATGTLNLKGTRRDIELPFRFNADGQMAQMSGELKLQRLWFDIGSGDWSTDELFGFDVQVRFDVRWRRAH